MRKYEHKNYRFFIGALVAILCSNLFAVSLQFFKGDVLDYAVAADLSNTILYGVLLVTFIILCEVIFYFVYAVDFFPS